MNLEKLSCKSPKTYLSKITKMKKNPLDKKTKSQQTHKCRFGNKQNKAQWSTTFKKRKWESSGFILYL